ncbi:ABC transporter substrate-binding protein [Ruminococcaceae bacterium OttesenSCG-928-A16]|nr:ABC transporter substrate-binding protein [Ruminococcaceae bacterium OttesenSCG-928-A16]
MKRAKSAVAILLATLLCAGLAACGSTPASTPSPSAPAGSAAPAASTPDKEHSGTVVVYSPHDADPLNAGINAFMEKYPSIKVEVVAAGTGELLNRIKAESANPIADVFWGGGADSLAAFKEHFAPYVCSSDDVIDEAYKDADDLWIGESPLPMVLFYNKALLEKDGLEVPTGWDSLLDPAWKGKIAYCLPSKSGSAYTQLVTMILGHGGKEDGWKFIEDLYANLDGKMVDSSGKCHKMVKDGEFYVGLTLEKSAVQYDGDDTVGYVYPQDGTSAVPDGVALVDGAPNEENAKLFIDYVLSYECQLRQSQDWGRRPVRNDIEVEGMIKLSDLVLVDYDFDWAANDKEQIVERFNDIMVG